MIIGIPKEIKSQENRVAITPIGVKEFKKNHHTVLVEADAGIGRSITDQEYRAVGAEIVDKAQLFKRADLIYKVKDIFPEEFKYLRAGLIIFTCINSDARS